MYKHWCRTYYSKYSSYASNGSNDVISGSAVYNVLICFSGKKFP